MAVTYTWKLHVPFHQEIKKIFGRNLKRYQITDYRLLFLRKAASQHFRKATASLQSFYLTNMFISFFLSMHLSKYLLHKGPHFLKGKFTCCLGLLTKIFFLSAVSVVHSSGLLLFSVAGDLNPNP